ncbi:AglZ/HisF2 family acetamidino modification protein [Methanocalculus sp. MC3]
MLQVRVIPCLLLKNGGLVKTIGFADPKYVGDPINAMRIFNEKEVDELILLDIDASRQGREPEYARIQEIVSEAFMPIAYGGGVTTVEQAQRLISLGVEKVVVNTAALKNLELVRSMADRLGSSSTVVAVDIQKDWLGRYRSFSAVTSKANSRDPIEYVQQAVEAGAGEIFINDVARDGTGKGYDLNLVKRICSSVDVPVTICGGAGTLEHLRAGASAGASAVAAGSMFVYMGKHRAVLLNYPKQNELCKIFERK